MKWESGTRVRGKIIKSLSGFYDVIPEDAQSAETVFRCRARGAFRSLHIKPMVGDDCEMEVTDTVSIPPEGNVITLLPRRNELIRPFVANVDQALLLFAITNPEPSYQMLDRFLIIMRQKNLPAIICFNKQDLATKEQIQELSSVYEKCGCRVLFTSNKTGQGWQELEDILAEKTTVITGPSGAGKSTLINRLCPGAAMETGELSRKIARGKNTTRHVEILKAGSQTYLIDTPGFTSLYLFDLKAQDLKNHYEEFEEPSRRCRFSGCSHDPEPDCGVKAAVQAGTVSRIRYQNYIEIYRDLKNQKPDY